jgi:uncharacterized protein (TIGR02217 family)
MSFSENRFPEKISYGAVGGEMFSTDIDETYGGNEKRNINWDTPRRKWNVSHGVKTPAQLEELRAFFIARKGRAYGFRYKCWQDYTATSQEIGVGDDSETEFQLVKKYTSNSDVFTRTINKPVADSITIYIDDVEQESGWSVDTTTGIITFDSAPAQDEVITADFEFDVPVRFDTDELNMSDDFPDGGGSWNSIPVIEIRI